MTKYTTDRYRDATDEPHSNTPRLVVLVLCDILDHLRERWPAEAPAPRPQGIHTPDQDEGVLTPEPEPLTVFRAHKDTRKAERRKAQSATYYGKYCRLPTDTVSEDTRKADRRQTPMAVRWTEPAPRQDSAYAGYRHGRHNDGDLNASGFVIPRGHRRATDPK